MPQITTSPQDITGDFDLVIKDVESIPITILKAPGAGGTEFEPLESFLQNKWQFVKNTGTNAYKLERTLPQGTAHFTQ